MSQPNRRRGRLARSHQQRSQETDNRVCLYIRASTTDQLNSLKAQEHSAREFAERNNLVIAEVYIEQITATKGAFAKRPQAREMLKFMKQNHVGTFLVLRIDRAFRSTSDFYQAIDQLNHDGIRLRMIDPDLDFTTPAGQLMLTLFVGIAQFECQIRAARQVDAYNVMRADRRPRNQNEPYGWRIDDNDGDPILRPIPHEQYTLRWMMDQYEAGHRVSHIADKLNESGTPTKKAGQLVNGKETSGKWFHLTVGSILDHAEFATEEEMALAEASDSQD